MQLHAASCSPSGSRAVSNVPRLFTIFYTYSEFLSISFYGISSAPIQLQIVGAGDHCSPVVRAAAKALDEADLWLPVVGDSAQQPQYRNLVPGRVRSMSNLRKGPWDLDKSVEGQVETSALREFNR